MKEEGLTSALLQDGKETFQKHKKGLAGLITAGVLASGCSTHDFQGNSYHVVRVEGESRKNSEYDFYLDCVNEKLIPCQDNGIFGCNDEKPPSGRLLVSYPFDKNPDLTIQIHGSFERRASVVCSELESTAWSCRGNVIDLPATSHSDLVRGEIWQEIKKNPGEDLDEFIKMLLSPSGEVSKKICDVHEYRSLKDKYLIEKKSEIDNVSAIIKKKWCPGNSWVKSFFLNYIPLDY